MTNESRPDPAIPVGREELQERIAAAFRSGRLPQSLLLLGPTGVGKQTMARWIATLVQCETAGPCGTCRSCGLAARLEHPDIHWHFPLARPKRASSRKKLREKLEEARRDQLVRIRAEPHEPWEPEGVTGIYLAAVDEIRAQAIRRPAMGDSTVFIVGSADRMVPQSANPEAANAFLKLLEEPPPFAYLVLTTSRPDALLPTIRSRSLALRVAPLDDAKVERFLRQRRGLEPRAAATIARRAHGSIGQALRMAAGTGDDERARATHLLEAALSPRESDRLHAAAGFASFGSRDVLARVLSSLSELLRDLLSHTLGRSDQTLDPERTRALGSGASLESGRLLRAFERVEEAREEAAGNLNPQGVVAVLLLDLAQALGPAVVRA